MATQFKIETGIPMPIGGNRKYPFADMQVGDSFLIPDDEAVSGQRSAHMWAARNGKKFATRKTSDGLRVWRIA